MGTMGRELGAEEMTRTGKGKDRHAPTKIETHGDGSARMVRVSGSGAHGESGGGLGRNVVTAGEKASVLVRRSRGLRGERASETDVRSGARPVVLHMDFPAGQEPWEAEDEPPRPRKDVVA